MRKRGERERRRKARRRLRLRRGAYLLPSLFTMGNVMLGFAAIVLGYRGSHGNVSHENFQNAALLVLLAGFLDGLDGRIARLTHTESEFGKEFDSLADVVTFGVTPALLTFFWGLQEHGRLGWLIPLFFLLCTAIRLARFNVQTRTVDSRYFVGLPSPLAAGAVVSLLFLITDQPPSPERQRWLEILMMLVLVGVGSLMVSTFRYPSLKKIDLHQRVSYRVALLVAATLLVLAVKPVAFFVSASLVYVLSGPWSWLFGRLRRRAGPRAETAETDPLESSP